MATRAGSAGGPGWQEHRGGGGQARGRPRGADAERVANFLGWFSVGLGVAQLVAPREMARLIGVRDDGESRSVLRAIGLRELAAGVGILSQERPAGWVWARVAGDAMDLALLGKNLDRDNPERHRTVAATAAVAGIAALDAWCAERLSRTPAAGMQRLAGEGATQRAGEAARGIQHRNSITVASTPEEAYRFWRNFENLPRFMRHLESVQVTDDRRSHWKASAPAGMTVEWDAELTEDRPNELIAWRSLEGADVYNEGRVEFRPAPGGRGTEVRVHLRYEPPGGRLGAAIAKLFREEPGQQVQDDLRRFKQVLETGDVVLSDATVDKGPHPAVPPARPRPELPDREVALGMGRPADEASAEAARETSSNAWSGPVSAATAGSRTGETPADFERRAVGGEETR